MYGPTFYPSTLDLSQAILVNARDQPEVTVQLALVPVKPVRVTGTVMSASGRSTEGLEVRLYRGFGGSGREGTVAIADAKGTFDIPRVAPGVYGLIIEPPGSTTGHEGREFVDTTIEVQDQDVNLSLTVHLGASLTGRVVAEPSGAITTPIGLQVRVSKTREPVAAGLPVGMLGTAYWMAAAVNGDWSFRLTGLSGSYAFHVSSDRLLQRVVATRVIVDGRSYSATEGVTFADGDHDVVLFVAPFEPKPTVDDTQTSSALVEQFRNEKFFWKQIEIAQAIAGKQDLSVLPPLADWLHHHDRHIRGNVAFIFASLGDPRGLETIADILADRSERLSGQGISRPPSDLRYRFEQQVAADRYYAAHLLGDLRDPRGVAFLVPLLDDPETQAIVPWSLAQIGDKSAIPPLIAALDHDDPSNRVLVIYALEALHAKEAIPRLVTLMNDDRKSRFGAAVAVSEAAKAAIARLQ
jgi:hypothetical protein